MVLLLATHLTNTWRRRAYVGVRVRYIARACARGGRDCNVKAGLP